MRHRYVHRLPVAAVEVNGREIDFAVRHRVAHQPQRAIPRIGHCMSSLIQGILFVRRTLSLFGANQFSKTALVLPPAVRFTFPFNTSRLRTHGHVGDDVKLRYAPDRSAILLSVALAVPGPVLSCADVPSSVRRLDRNGMGCGHDALLGCCKQLPGKHHKSSCESRVHTTRAPAKLSGSLNIQGLSRSDSRASFSSRSLLGLSFPSVDDSSIPP
jgi:hypothetical protein